MGKSASDRGFRSFQFKDRLANEDRLGIDEAILPEKKVDGIGPGVGRDCQFVVAHLAVVLPGANNDPWTAPLLLPSLALEEMGAKVERVSYGEPRAPGLGLEESMEFNARVSEQVAAIVDQHDPAKVTFVAKSLGTLSLAVMDKALLHCKVEAVWVTPLLGLDHVRGGVLDKEWPSLIVAGSADPYHVPVTHAEVCAALRAQDLVIEGADHGLVVQGDVLATVEGFRRIAEVSLAFAAIEARD